MNDSTCFNQCQGKEHKKQVDVTEIRYIHPIWSEWRDLNSRPLDPQRLFGVNAAIRKIEKTPILARFNGVLPSLSDALFYYFFLPFWYGSGTVFGVVFAASWHKIQQVEKIALFKHYPIIIIPCKTKPVKNAILNGYSGIPEWVKLRCCRGRTRF